MEIIKPNENEVKLVSREKLLYTSFGPRYISRIVNLIRIDSEIQATRENPEGTLRRYIHPYCWTCSGYLTLVLKYLKKVPIKEDIFKAITRKSIFKGTKLLTLFDADKNTEHRGPYGENYDSDYLTLKRKLKKSGIELRIQVH